MNILAIVIVSYFILYHIIKSATRNAILEAKQSNRQIRKHDPTVYRD
jgi:hypothetical protein